MACRVDVEVPEQDQRSLQQQSSDEKSSKSTPEYDFIEQPSQDFFCPVTLELLTEPHQTTCCGNHLSQEAANRLQRDGKPCPMCKERQLVTMPDKYMKRRVNNLRVRCSYKESGCEWEGEVCTLEDHINTCPKRPWHCQYCDFQSTYSVGMSEHVPKCTNYPVVCPNSCEVDTVPRCDLETHLMECPLELVACKYAEVGCDAKIPRRDLACHIEEGQQQHILSATLVNLQLTRENLAEKDQVIAEKDRVISIKDQQLIEKDRVIIDMKCQIADLQEQLKAQQDSLGRNIAALHKDVKNVYCTLQGYTCYDITVTEFSQAGKWLSNLLSCEGYNIKLYCNFSEPVLSVLLGLYRGDSDNKLDWPVKFTCCVELINQLGDHSHRRANWSARFNSKTDTSTFESVGNLCSLISSSELGCNAKKNTQYLKDDSIKLQVYIKCAKCD